MFRFFRILRSTVMLTWVCGTLAASTIFLGVQAVTLSTQVATLTVGAATSALQHRKNVAKAVSKTKAKARLRRILVAVPFIGGGAALAFETQDFQAWQKEHPDEAFAEYSCEVAEASAEVVDEVLQELPETIRPSKDLLLRGLSNCDSSMPAEKRI